MKYHSRTFPCRLFNISDELSQAIADDFIHMGEDEMVEDKNEENKGMSGANSLG